MKTRIKTVTHLTGDRVDSIEYSPQVERKFLWFKWWSDLGNIIALKFTRTTGFDGKKYNKDVPYWADKQFAKDLMDWYIAGCKDGKPVKRTVYEYEDYPDE